jgi:hypothetical protein
MDTGDPDGTLRAPDTPLAREYAENLPLQSDMRDSLVTMACWERGFSVSLIMRRRAQDRLNSPLISSPLIIARQC